MNLTRTMVAATAVGIASLSLATAAHAAVNPVTALTGDWSASGKVQMTPYGADFGPLKGWQSGHSEGGDVTYNGFHGKLKDLTRLTYTARYSTADPHGQGGDAPYLRIYFADGKDAIYDPSSVGNNGSLTENVDHTRDTMQGIWRYDDDCGDSILDSTEDGSCGTGAWPPTGTESGYGIYGAPFAKLLAEHGDETIDHISVSAGYQFSDQVEAVMTRMRVNGNEFDFGTGGPQGQQGDPGATGATGPTVEQGPVSQGANTGANAASGTSGANTVLAAPSSKLVGNSVRTLHVSKQHKGAKLLAVKANLRGHTLRIIGNTIKVDLRHGSVGNYNVMVKATYKQGGKTHVVHTTRSLSVTLA